MRNMSEKILAIMLSMVLVVGLMPLSAFGEVNSNTLQGTDISEKIGANVSDDGIGNEGEDEESDGGSGNEGNEGNEGEEKVDIADFEIMYFVERTPLCEVQSESWWGTNILIQKQNDNYDVTLNEDADEISVSYYRVGQNGNSDELLNGIPQEIGSYRVEIVPSDNQSDAYTGQLKKEFQIGDWINIATNEDDGGVQQGSNKFAVGEVPKLSLYYWTYNDDGESIHTDLIENKDFKVVRSGSSSESVEWSYGQATTQEGTYWVDIEGLGNYVGLRYDTFEVVAPIDISTFEIMNFQERNRASAGTIDWKDDCIYLEGKDATDKRIELSEYHDGFSAEYYRIQGENKVKLDHFSDEDGDYVAGNYEVVIKGDGHMCTGGFARQFSLVNASSIKWTDGGFDKEKYGIGQTPRLNLMDDKESLIEGTDYAASIKSAPEGAKSWKLGEPLTVPGDYELTVTGINEYVDSVTFSFTAYEANDITLADITYSNLVLSSEEVRSLDLEVKMGNEVLVKNTDYTVSYSYYNDETYEYESVEGLSHAGQYEMTVVGKSDKLKGKYTDSIKVANPIDISQFTFDNYQQEVNLRDSNNWAGIGNECSDDAPRLRGVIDNQEEYYIDRSAIDGFTVKYFSADSNQALKEKPIELGNYRIEATGTGRYQGTVSANFTIVNKHSLSNIAWMHANGSELLEQYGSNSVPKTSDVRLYDRSNGYKMLPTKDFTIELQKQSTETQEWSTVEGNASETGQYRFLAKGIGDDYTGENSWEFTVVPANSLELASLDYAYYQRTSEVPYEPTIMVKLGDKVLQAGTDYTLTYFSGVSGYDNHDAVPGITKSGYYTVELTGCGNYTGTCTLEMEAQDLIDISTFKIRGFQQQVPLRTIESETAFWQAENFGLYDDDKQVSGSNIEVTFFTAAGSKLEGTPTELGTFKIQVTGRGRYEGIVTGEFKVVNTVSMNSLSSTITNGVIFGLDNVPRLKLYDDFYDYDYDYDFDNAVPVMPTEYIAKLERKAGDTQWIECNAPDAIGQYRYTLTGIETSVYQGERTIEFQVVAPNDLKLAQVSLTGSLYDGSYDYDYDHPEFAASDEPYELNNMFVWFRNSNTDSYTTLINGIDYTVSYERRVTLNQDEEGNDLSTYEAVQGLSKVGFYRITIKATEGGSYSGSVVRYASVEEYTLRDLSTAQFAGSFDCAYTEHPVNPLESLGLGFGYSRLQVRFANNRISTLNVGSEIALSYQDAEGHELTSPPSAKGEYRLLVKAIPGNTSVKGQNTITFHIRDGKDIATFGNEEGLYVVLQDNSSLAADETVQTGEGDKMPYPNIKYLSAKELSQDEQLSVNDSFSYSIVNSIWDTTPLTANTPLEPGSYYVCLEGKNSWFGEVYLPFEVIKYDKFDLSNASVSCHDTQPVSREPYTPEFTLKIDNQVIDSTNYTVAIRDDYNYPVRGLRLPGEYEIVVTGNDKTYHGQRTFGITVEYLPDISTGFEISDLKKTYSLDYFNESYGDSFVIKGKDADGQSYSFWQNEGGFTVQFQLVSDTSGSLLSKPNSVGKWYAVVTGSSGCTGSFKQEFEVIDATSLNSKNIWCSLEGAATRSIFKKGDIPKVTLTDDTKTLVEGTDFTVSMQRREQVGRLCEWVDCTDTNMGAWYRMVVVGKGNYIDTLYRQFRVQEFFEKQVTSIDELHSARPYENNTYQTWVYTDSSAIYGFAVTFDQYTETEAKCDVITIFDGNNKEIETYSGTQLAGKTVLVPNTTTFKIRLDTDESLRDYGFGVTQVRKLTEEAASSIFTLQDIWVGDKAASMWRSDAVYPATKESTPIQLPAVLVKVGNRTFTQGQDYSVRVLDSRNATQETQPITPGIYYLEIKNLKQNPEDADRFVFAFEVKARTDMYFAQAEIRAITEGDSNMNPVAKVTDLDGKELVAGTDYELKFYDSDMYGYLTNPISMPSKAGKYVVAIQGLNTYSNYLAKHYVVAQQKQGADENTDVSLAGARVVLNTPNVPIVYTGQKLTPAISVYTSPSNQKVPAEAYEIKYANNTNAGTANITVTAKTGSGYRDSTSGTFQITKATVALPNAVSGLTYNGVSQQGVVTTSALYEVTGNWGVDAKSYLATAKLKDASNYTWAGLGTSANQVIDWKISSKSINAAKVILQTTSSKFNKKLQKGTVKSVVLNSQTIPSSGYSVTTATGKNIGTYKVTVTGKGNYQGSASANFTITAAHQTITPVKNLYSVKSKKKNQSISVSFKASGGGKITYGAAKSGKVVLVKNGKVIVKKAAAKKTYTLKVKVSAAAKGNYAKTTKTVVLKVRVK